MTVALAVSLAEVVSGSPNVPDAVAVLVTDPVIAALAVKVSVSPGVRVIGSAIMPS